MLQINWRKRALFILIFIGLSFNFQALASDDDVLATIGEENITRAEMEDEYEAFLQAADEQAARAFATSEGKKKFLEQLTELFALQKKAKSEGLEDTKDYKEMFNDNALGILGQLQMHELLESIEVTDDEIEDFYNSNKEHFRTPQAYRLSKIIVPTHEAAVDIMEKLEQGGSFMELAREHSMGDYASSGGDMGFVPENHLDNQLGMVLRNLEKNEVSAPVNIGTAFAIVRYTDVRASEEKGLEEVKEQIREDLIELEAQTAYNNEIDRLKEEFSFKLNRSVLQGLTGGELTQEQMEETLFEYSGKTVPVSELEKELAEVPAFLRPQLFSGDALESIIRRFYSQYLIKENASRNFAQLSAKFPEVIKNVARQTMVRLLIDSILADVALSDEDIKHFYQQNMSRFQMPAQMDAHHILVGERDQAEEIIKKLKQNPEKFEELASKKSNCPSGKQNNGHLGQFGQGQMVPEFDKACLDAPINEIVGPVKTNFGYHIIRVNSRQDASVQPIEEVREQIEANLLPQKQIESIQNFVEQIKKEYEVKIFQDRL